jgi:hypothetical protein
MPAMSEALPEEVMEAVDLLSKLDVPRMRTSQLLRMYGYLTGTSGPAMLLASAVPEWRAKTEELAREIDRRIPVPPV